MGGHRRDENRRYRSERHHRKGGLFLAVLQRFSRSSPLRLDLAVRIRIPPFPHHRRISNLNTPTLTHRQYPLPHLQHLSHPIPPP